MFEENFEPLISVIIPSYNSEKYISETIHSVLNQTYQRFEILVVDDSSEDSTCEVVKKIAAKDKRINIFKIEHSGAPSIPRNFGIKKANGELIAFIDSDDLWVKNKLERQLKYFKRFPELIFVYSMSVTFGDVSIFSSYYEVLPLTFRAAHTRNDLINGGNSIPLSTVMVWTNKLREINGFDEDPELNIGEDYDLWIRLSSLGKFIFIPRIQTYYRIHQKQLSNNWEVNKKKLEYLAKKRNLKLPAYNYYRDKGLPIRIARNSIHILNFIWVKFISLFDKI